MSASTPTARRRLKQWRDEPVIPSRKDQLRQPGFDKAAYRERNKVERQIGRLKQYRRIATRYEKRAANYLVMVTLGMTMLCSHDFSEMPQHYFGKKVC